jgi:hypothetical protein
MKAGVIDSRINGHMLFALLLMAQFQLWDGIMTQVFVTSGIAREANQLMAPLITGNHFLLIKLVGIATLPFLLWLVFKRLPGVALAAASCVALFYLTVITWNFIVLFSGPF